MFIVMYVVCTSRSKIFLRFFKLCDSILFYSVRPVERIRFVPLPLPLWIGQTLFRQRHPTSLRHRPSLRRGVPDRHTRSCPYRREAHLHRRCSSLLFFTMALWQTEISRTEMNGASFFRHPFVLICALRHQPSFLSYTVRPVNVASSVDVGK